MKRFRITLMVPHVEEVIVPDIQSAHNEATKLVTAQSHQHHGDVILSSIEFVNEVITEPLEFTRGDKR